MASWAGNLMMAKTHGYFPSDVVVVAMAAGATLQTVTASDGKKGSLSVAGFMDASYAPPPDLVLIGLTFPLAGDGAVVDSYKVMGRHANAHAVVNAGFALAIGAPTATDGVPTIGSSNTLVVGNISQGPLLCTKTAAALAGQPLSLGTFTAALPVFSAEVAAAMDAGPPDPDLIIEAAAERQALVEALLYKFFLGAISRASPALPAGWDHRLDSAAAHYERPVSAGAPSFSPPPASFPREKPVGEPIAKLEGGEQAAGEVQYTGDLPRPAGTLFGAPATVGPGDVGKTVSSIDASAALGMAGVSAFVSAKDIADIGGSNSIGAYEVFATSASATSHVGQFVGLVLASSLDVAARAAKRVKVSLA